MTTTTESVAWPLGAMCETSPSAPIVAATDVKPSSSGTDAATNAPNASARITSVIGSVMICECCRSLVTICVIVFSIEPRAGLLDRDARLAARNCA